MSTIKGKITAAILLTVIISTAITGLAVIFAGSNAISVVAILTVCVILFALIAIAVATKISADILSPIAACIRRLSELASGDINSPVPMSTSSGETKELIDATGKIILKLRAVISDEQFVLKSMASGDFNVAPDKNVYTNDFESLYQSIDKIIEGMSTTLSEINTVATQVSEGADQISSGAVELSQGVTEQASSVEELAATINEISNDINNTAKHAEDGKKVSFEAGNSLEQSNEKMKELFTAMEEINESSIEISKIIKTIEDIAFQTNILALNAAVEAARAGSAGKGFAVVADEVRNLASKSSEASQNTTDLISKSSAAVEKGNSIVRETFNLSEHTGQSAEKAVSAMVSISEATEHQADAISQISIGVDQISSVIQLNSATAEKSASSSEELSAMAERLKELMAKFILRDGTVEVKTSEPLTETSVFSSLISSDKKPSARKKKTSTSTTNKKKSREKIDDKNKKKDSIKNAKNKKSTLYKTKGDSANNFDNGIEPIDMTVPESKFATDYITSGSVEKEKNISAVSKKAVLDNTNSSSPDVKNVSYSSTASTMWKKPENSVSSVSSMPIGDITNLDIDSIPVETLDSQFTFNDKY